jgi:hypothetical protein
MRFKLRVVPHRAPFFFGSFCCWLLVISPCYFVFLFHLATLCSCFTLLFWFFVSPCYHALLLHLIVMPCYFNLLCRFLAMLCCFALLHCLIVSFWCFTLFHCCMLLQHLVVAPCYHALLHRLVALLCQFTLLGHLFILPWIPFWSLSITNFPSPNLEMEFVWKSFFHGFVCLKHKCHVFKTRIMHV